MSSIAKQKGSGRGGAGDSGGFWSELFRFGVYKPNQGRIVRQLSFLAIAILTGACSVRASSHAVVRFDVLRIAIRVSVGVRFGSDLVCLPNRELFEVC